jgi:hypothetical protein
MKAAMPFTVVGAPTLTETVSTEPRAGVAKQIAAKSHATNKRIAKSASPPISLPISV